MKALILTYYWPPSGGSGVQRWMYFARYLQEFGIEPVVITVDEKYASYSSTDESLVEKVKHVRVYKTKTLEPLRFYSFLKSGNAKKEIPQGNVGGKKKGLIDKFATYVRANFFIPDARVGWNRYAFSKASELIRNEKFDVIITTGPPHSTHLVGLKLKKKFDIQWIADFRDPWTEVYYNELFKRTPKNALKDQNLELSVLQKADCILTVGPSMKDLLDRKIPGQQEKVKYIYNGYDSEKMNGISRKAHSRFTICYVGILNANYPYQPFVTALTNCLEKHPDWEVTLKLVGRIEEDVIAAFETIPGIELIKNGNVPHPKALETMINADLLLLILPADESSKIIVSGKLLEYVASNVPILGILNPASDAAALIHKFAQGQAFHPDEIDQITSFLSNLKNGELPIKQELGNFEDFDRKNTAKQLAALIRDQRNNIG